MKIDKFLMFLSVSSGKTRGYFNLIEFIEGQLDLAGSGIVLPPGFIAVVEDLIQLGQVLVGMRMAALFD